MNNKINIESSINHDYLRYVSCQPGGGGGGGVRGINWSVLIIVTILLTADGNHRYNQLNEHGRKLSLIL